VGGGAGGEGVDVQNYPSASCEDGQAVLTAEVRKETALDRSCYMRQANSAPSLHPAL